jgi:hypothetical protein
VGYRAQDEVCEWHMSCRGAAVGTVHCALCTYRPVILPGVLCGRAEHGLGVFESRVLRGKK